MWLTVRAAGGAIHTHVRTRERDRPAAVPLETEMPSTVISPSAIETPRPARERLFAGHGSESMATSSSTVVPSELVNDSLPIGGSKWLLMRVAYHLMW